MSYLLTSIFRSKAFLDRHTKLWFFRKKCQNPLPAQWSFLKTLLKIHRNTEFGKKYDFASIQNIRDYQERVPIHRWEDVAPYVEAIQKGNQEALFPPSEKVLMFAKTSGTTDEPKLIPVTETSNRHYKRYWDYILAAAAPEIPWFSAGKILYFPGDWEEGYAGNIPFGSISGIAYGRLGPLKKSLYPYPHQISKIKDYQLRYYTIMRIALEKRITHIVILNPSTIVTLFKVARDFAADIIEDIQYGRLRNSNDMPRVFVESVLRKIRPNPKRAEELREILRERGDFLPRDYWPNPMIVSCFASGPVQLYLKQLYQYLNNMYLFDIGLFASEGRFSFPIASIKRESGCCLTLESNFFEFIPEDDIEASQPQVLTLDQCEVGKRYFIIITNYSGLYRYNISDVVEVTGFYEKVPLITFCYKGKHFSNITGEKLTEFQVTESVRRAGEKVGYHLNDFVFCLHWDDVRPSYSLLMRPDTSADPAILQRFIDRVDEELMVMNVEYRAKRESLRLGPLVLKTVAGKGYQEYENQNQRASRNLAQYKHTFLINDPTFESRFQFAYEMPSTLIPQVISSRISGNSPST